MMALFLVTFLLLALGHFMADYALQGDWLAAHKCPASSVEGVAPHPWIYVMCGHAATHGLLVYLLVGHPLVALLEFVAHFLIDLAKCRQWFGIHLDQLLHLACKAAWTAGLLYGWF